MDADRDGTKESVSQTSAAGTPEQVIDSDQDGVIDALGQEFADGSSVVVVDTDQDGIYDVSIEVSPDGRIRDVSASELLVQRDALSSLSPEKKMEMVDQVLTGIPKGSGGTPEVILSNRDPENAAASYLPPGSLFAGERLTSPTIVLYQGAFESREFLAVTIEHEIVHYEIDQFGGPSDFAKEADSRADKAVASYDYSGIPKGFRPEAQDFVREQARAAYEHVYIAEKQLASARARGAPAEISFAEALVKMYKREESEYRTSAKNVYMSDGNSYRISPKLKK